ncbi:serine hydrolase domain-containing protein [Kordiimonas gwangyangensis]|uniref:serine hydrolase domain-containing protein n=1 Tax=Kordiimonas gwangyangensis TaxID=288022 RepID=UPI0003A5879B|nr:serine hydrolase domain-containing protein [Kordiimonas gwangyangensis]
MLKRLSLLLVLVSTSWFAHASELPTASPEDVGLSAEKLEAMKAHFQSYVDEHKLAGLTTLVSRHGKVAHFETYGVRTLESGEPMAKDAIFRIYSMTKPVTGVALMMLYEEGKFELDDPVSKYIPAFKDQKVFKGVNEDGSMITEPTAREMTVRDLMRHTSGLSYGVFSETPVDMSYRKGQLIGFDQPLSEWVPKLARQPLLYQPGKAWVYSLSVDVQGYLVEVLSGQTFDEFLKTRIFDPLGMSDTGFYVSEEKVDRLVGIYDLDKEKGLTPTGNALIQDFTKEPLFKSGGGGLLSTTADYWRFAQMVANGGGLDGVRILKAETVDMMRTNQLPEGVNGIGGKGVVGFGLDFAVLTNAEAFGGGNNGEFYWGGMANTVFWIDPVSDVVAIFMTNVLPYGAVDPRTPMRKFVNEAVVN